MAGATNIEPGPFCAFGYLVVDVIDGDGQATLVAAGHHATIIVAWGHGDNPRIGAHSVGNECGAVDTC